MDSAAPEVKGHVGDPDLLKFLLPPPSHPASLAPEAEGSLLPKKREGV